MFCSTGTLRYGKDPYKLIVEIDPEIGRYYYKQILGQNIRVNKQKYATHISVVRKEIPPLMEHWGKYEGKQIEFAYEHHLYNDATYYWLNVWCQELEEIRKELGCRPTSAFTRGPDGAHRFHATIANIKGIV